MFSRRVILISFAAVHYSQRISDPRYVAAIYNFYFCCLRPATWSVFMLEMWTYSLNKCIVTDGEAALSVA
jgi:hypothetical protein